MLLVLAISGGWADDYPRNPQIDVLHYVFELALNDENDVISGITTIGRNHFHSNRYLFHRISKICHVG